MERRGLPLLIPATGRGKRPAIRLHHFLLIFLFSQTLHLRSHLGLSGFRDCARGDSHAVLKVRYGAADLLGPLSTLRLRGGHIARGVSGRSAQEVSMNPQAELLLQLVATEPGAQPLGQRMKSPRPGPVPLVRGRG